MNIPEQELSYQVYDYKKQMPAIEGTQTEEWKDHIFSYNTAIPAKKIRNGKTGFAPKIIRDEQFKPEIVFSSSNRVLYSNDRTTHGLLL